MTIKRYATSLLGRVALVGCALLWLALPARAAYYTGVWDPTYGSPFTDLGWRGSAEFFVPDFCKSTGTADVGNTAECDGLAAVQSATVEFYNTTDPNLNTVISFGFNPLSLVIDSLRYVDGALTELTTSSSNFVLPDADLSKFGVPSGTVFSLLFDFTGPHLTFVSCNPDTCTTGTNDSVNFPPTFVITEVPEPATPALAGLALLMVVALRRRARSAR